MLLLWRWFGGECAGAMYVHLPSPLVLGQRAAATALRRTVCRGTTASKENLQTE